MARTWSQKWFTGRSRRAVKRLSLETLESRLVPTTSSVSLISVTADGTSGNGVKHDRYQPVPISEGGRYVVFESPADDLIAGQIDNNGGRDVFLRDRQTGTTTLVSHEAGSSATTGNSISFDPSISADGLSVVYVSVASDLVSGVSDTNSNFDVFRYDDQEGLTTVESPRRERNNNAVAGRRSAAVQRRRQRHRYR